MKSAPRPTDQALVSNPGYDDDDDDDELLPLWVIILIAVAVLLLLAVVAMGLLYSWKHGFLGSRMRSEVVEDGETIVAVGNSYISVLIYLCPGYFFKLR